MSLFNELKRRNVFKVAIAYIVMAWLVMQVADVILNNITAPDWIFRVLLLFLSVGLLFAVFFAWAYELTPEGLKRDRDAAPSPQAGRKLNVLIFTVLGLALAWFAWDKFVAGPQRDGSEPESALHKTAPASELAATGDGSRPELQTSIAVLPFVSMSEDPENEYFADGISEELLNMLVKIPDLRVAARTSSFSFKGKGLKVSEIAEEMNVSHLLQGSVRKSGNRVRITAQLIKADEGFHLWSETFDRTLDDIFVVQDEIASEVAQALEMTLMGGTLAERRIDSNAYALYLQGLHFLRSAGAENYQKSEEALLRAIEIDSGYADPWATLAMNYYYQTRFNLKTLKDGSGLAKNAIDQAKRLGPELGVTWGIDGYLKKNLDWDWAAAQAAINKAYALAPQDNSIRVWRASLAATLGRLEDAAGLYEQSLLNDPLSLSLHSAVGIAFTKIHRYDSAIRTFERQVELKPDYHWGYFSLGKCWLFKGDAEQALVEIRKNPENVFRYTGLVLAYSTLDRHAEAEQALHKLVSEYGEDDPGWVAEAYAWRGQKDEAFQWLDKAFLQRSSTLVYVLGNNVFYSLRDDPRWVELLEKMDLLEYWEAMPAEYGGPSRAAD